MRLVTSIGLVMAVMVAAGLWSTGSAHSVQGPAQLGAPSGGLITHQYSGGAAGDHLVVLDPSTRVMAVYRIGRDKGEIDLTAVRNVTWDLRMLGYNTQKPLPEEIRAGLDRRN